MYVRSSPRTLEQEWYYCDCGVATYGIHGCQFESFNSIILLINVVITDYTQIYINLLKKQCDMEAISRTSILIFKSIPTTHLGIVLPQISSLRARPLL